MTDAPLRRSGRGEVVIPGSSLAGALRSVAVKLAAQFKWKDGVKSRCDRFFSGETAEPCDCLACKLFGDIKPGEESTGANASKLWIYDAVPELAVKTSIRDSLGMDRLSGTASAISGAKFDKEVTAMESVFELKLKCENPSDGEEQLLAASLREWEQGRGWIGAGRSRGAGAFELVEMNCREENLDEAAGLMVRLRAETPWQSGEEKKGWMGSRINTLHSGCDDNSIDFLTIEAVLQCDGPFLTCDAANSALYGYDHAPLLAGFRDENRPLLPGSSLRGVLRSQGERILRTVASQLAAGQKEPSRWMNERNPACDPVLRASGFPLQSCDAKLGQNPAGIEQLCLACQFFGSSRNGSRFIVEDAPYCASVPPIYKVFDFVAIDRFTGGAKDGAKFDALALWKPEFRIRLHIEQPRRWEMGLIYFILRDMDQGFASIGFGAAKGFGQVSCRDWRWKMISPGKREDGVVWQAEKLKDIEPLRTAAADWAGELHKEIAAYHRIDALVYEMDSYFECAVKQQPTADRLYSPEVEHHG